jgi:AAA ATPase-like protein
MRKYLFVDNFRGFDNAYVPILDVNFLVGENSTGKTSFLGLLKLIASQRVMFHHDFGDEDVNFGNFGDMVSAHSKDRTYFTIGIAQDYPGGTSTRRSESPQPYSPTRNTRASRDLLDSQQLSTTERYR